MADLPLLLRQLEFADFATRQRLAELAARELTGEQLAQLRGHLDHPLERVRLGVIELLWRADHREGLPALLAHAQKRTGDDRVFAIRALAFLAKPGDELLRAPAAAWAGSSDPFVEAQGRALARALGEPDRPAPPVGPAAPRPVVPAPVVVAPAPTGDPAAALAALLAARSDGERIALVATIERAGAAALATAAEPALRRGNADVVALLCRALIRQAPGLPAPQDLIPLLEAARTRLGDSPLALSALDDALLELEGLTLSGPLLVRLASTDERQLAEVLRRLHDRPATELALSAPALLDALAQRPSLWSSLGPILVDAAPHLRESARVQLRALCEEPLGRLRRGQELETLVLLSVSWVLAQIADRGEPLCRPLRVALERMPLVEAQLAFCALCARVATEEAALALVALLRDPDPQARAAAEEALRGFQSPWARVVAGDPPSVTLSYQSTTGAALVRQDARLLAAGGGEEYALDGRGNPVRIAETEHGACLCCGPPRVLVRRKEDGLRCPASWESYLREGSRVVREQDHPLGRCRQCDTIRPRVREGSRLVCPACGSGRTADAQPGAPPLGPPMPSERPDGDGDETLPTPPTQQELELIAPHIRAAIAANVFLLARHGEGHWFGSGIIIARDGANLAILTNRHVVEDNQQALVALRALTVAGELVPATTLWRAARGIDLALIEIQVERTDPLAVMPLGTGTGLVGAQGFVVGNPLGLAWSYTSGTLSAIRHWTTHEGQSVRILQTDAHIAPGSSGGGLFHADGHLLGVISFLHQGNWGGSAHFALSVDAVKEAFLREGVRWRGRALTEPAPPSSPAR